MNEIKTWEGAFPFFYRYFSSGMDISKTLREYGMVTGRYNPQVQAAKWKELRSKYPEEYKSAKETYMESIGIHSASVWQKIWQIANNSTLDRDRLKALELIAKFLDGSNDASVLCQAQTLQIEVIPTPAQAMAEDIIYTKEDDTNDSNN